MVGSRQQKSGTRQSCFYYRILSISGILLSLFLLVIVFQYRLDFYNAESGICSGFGSHNETRIVLPYLLKLLCLEMETIVW